MEGGGADNSRFKLDKYLLKMCDKCQRRRAGTYRQGWIGLLHGPASVFPGKSDCAAYAIRLTCNCKYPRLGVMGK